MSADFLKTFKERVNVKTNLQITNEDAAELSNALVDTIISSARNSVPVNFKDKVGFKRVLRKRRTFIMPNHDVLSKPDHYVLCMTVAPATKKQFGDCTPAFVETKTLKVT